MSRNWILGIAAGALLATSAGAQATCGTCIDSITGQWHMLPALGIRAGVPLTQVLLTLHPGILSASEVSAIATPATFFMTGQPVLPEMV